MSDKNNDLRPGDRYPEIRYAGYAGVDSSGNLTGDKAIAYKEGVDARNRAMGSMGYEETIQERLRNDRGMIPTHEAANKIDELEARIKQLEHADSAINTILDTSDIQNQ